MEQEIKGKITGLKYAYKLLSIRDYFKNELYSKIENKFGNEEAENTISEIEKLGYIDDEKVAYNYTRAKLQAGYGPYYITNKLYLKGCFKDISYIENVAEKEKIDMAEYIIKFSKRYIIEKSKDSYKCYIKCINFLKNRGYSPSMVMDIINKEDFK